MDYEQMKIDITLESDRDLKENMQATAKFALGGRLWSISTRPR